MSVVNLRKQLISQELMNVIEMFAFRELESIHITGVQPDGKIRHFSFGTIPRRLADIAENSDFQVIELRPKNAKA
jgi:hypothetical protein